MAQAKGLFVFHEKNIFSFFWSTLSLSHRTLTNFGNLPSDLFSQCSVNIFVLQILDFEWENSFYYKWNFILSLLMGLLWQSPSCSVWKFITRTHFKPLSQTVSLRIILKLYHPSMWALFLETPQLTKDSHQHLVCILFKVPYVIFITILI